MSWYDNAVPFETLKGMTLAAIQGSEGSDELLFETTEGRTFRMFHDQDCCESVSVEDIAGNLEDLIGSPILMAEEVASHENPPDVDPKTVEWQDSFTWTFYKLATVKGYVTIRWYGESNGYYSESVDFAEVK